jgi:hypothetical protein
MGIVQPVAQEPPCMSVFRAHSPSSSRGRAVCTVAAMRKVAMSSVDPDDPLVEELMQLPAYALDRVRMRYRAEIHGPPSLAAACAVVGWVASDSPI